jgi:GDP/UDP-N,N'-diacetylbacillosamine 2-epimerase (hydrolysing)
MSDKRKIIAVSGARSDYDLLFKVYEKLNSDDRFDFSIIITGPNLSETYGYTAQNIENDHFRIAGRIFNLVDSNQKIGRAVSIGYQIPSLAHILLQEQPDLILVAGDREEAISVSLTCGYMDIALAHFFGGDIAKDGNIDNSVRYATSKFAHIHFPTLEEHKQTLLKLGEDDWRIHVVGNPALDRFLETPEISKDAIVQTLAGDKLVKDYCVLIQHSIITQVEQQAAHIRMTLESILKSGKHCFVNYPNSDAGSSAIIDAYQEYAKKYPEHFTLFQNLDRTTYVNLLRHALFLIGNSSSGLVEVGSLGLPAINIGERQRGRLHGDNILFVDNDETEIAQAIDQVLNDQLFLAKVKLKNNPYGDGKSTEKIVDVLAKIEINSRLIHKNITY